MRQVGSRGIRRVATVALMGGLVTLAATPALAATAGPAPDGTRVTGTGDGYPWIGSNPAGSNARQGITHPDGNPWHGIAWPGGHMWDDSTPATDGNPWHDGVPWGGNLGAADDGHPWHNLLATDGHPWHDSTPWGQ